MDNKRVLFVVNNSAFFLSHRLPLARGARDAGFEVHVAALPVGETAAILKEGFIFHPIRISQGKGSFIQELLTFFAIYRLYISLKPSFVHNVGIKQVLYGGVAARFARIPAVVNALTGLGYSFCSKGLKASLLRFFYMQLFRFAFGHPRHRLIVQNHDDKRLFLDAGIISENQISLIRGSGVDMNVFNVSEDAEGLPLVVFASRMLWDKGVKEFVDAATILKARKVQARFALIGDTDWKNPRAVPTEQLTRWQTEGVVEFWGHREDMPDIFAASRIVCLPSFYREGVPKVLIEAAACGLPIITTQEPGCREIVIDGVNGILVPARDGNAVAEAIGRLLAEPELCRRMGLQGRKLAASEFSVEKVVGETLNVYRQLLV